MKDTTLLRRMILAALIVILMLLSGSMASPNLHRGSVSA